MGKNNRDDRRMLLNEDVDLCTGCGCPEQYRNTCYRYQLHHFFDEVAKNTRQRLFYFVEPAVKMTVNGKCHCRNHREILYIDKPR